MYLLRRIYKKSKTILGFFVGFRTVRNSDKKAENGLGFFLYISVEEMHLNECNGRTHKKYRRALISYIEKSPTYFNYEARALITMLKN